MHNDWRNCPPKNRRHNFGCLYFKGDSLFYGNRYNNEATDQRELAQTYLQVAKDSMILDNQSH